MALYPGVIGGSGGTHNIYVGGICYFDFTTTKSILFTSTTNIVTLKVNGTIVTPLANHIYELSGGETYVTTPGVNNTVIVIINP